MYSEIVYSNDVITRIDSTPTKEKHVLRAMLFLNAYRYIGETRSSCFLG